jgi:hypothetical protein
MCQACLEAELWLAYQEEMAEKKLAKGNLAQENLARDDIGGDDMAEKPSAGMAAPTSLTPPEPSASPFGCEELPST